jgi:alpha-L-fucosidase 2
MQIPARFAFVLLAFAAAVRAAAPVTVEYSKAGGESLKLDACVPDGPGPFPAVILVHGGGWNSGDKEGGRHRGMIAPMEDPLLAGGFAWFSINYRLAPKHSFPAPLDDVEASIRWLKAHAAEYRVDPRRIALAGESAGGHLVALAGVSADPTVRVAAVVDFYGPIDLLAKVRAAGGNLEPGLAGLFGSAALDHETAVRLQAASPINFVRPGLPPFLLLHGTADKSVPFENSVDLQAKLRAAGDTCDLIVIPGGAHGMINWDKIAPDYKERVVSWLSRTIAAPTP